MLAEDDARKTKIQLLCGVNGGLPRSRICDLLVIACDPRSLDGICNYTTQEREIFNKITNFTFHTTLLKVKRKAVTPEHGVVFAPTRLNNMSGSVYGFRNETGKAFGMNTSATPDNKPANELPFNWVTVYQLVRAEDTPPDPAEFERMLRTSLNEGVSWPYGDDYEICESVTTKYFDHFVGKDLVKGENGEGHEPWRYMDIQGQNGTIYVHASTCFESVLHCWLYIKMLLDPNNPIVVLPEDKDAAIVILGAGPSGLLFANELRELNYGNVTILEKTDRIGGKTHTIVKEQPGNNQDTVCELGTCYLSPAYDSFVTAMHPYLTGNERIGFGGSEGNFRGIVTNGQFSHLKAPPLVTYYNYIILKAADELKCSPNDVKKIQDKIADDLERYCDLHQSSMGSQRPMPRNPPQKLFENPCEQTFLEFLRENKLQSLIGLLQYGYSVQGYGNLSTIPTYYGLLWVTPNVARKIEYSFRHPKHPGGDIVTAWSKGWGDLWTQISAQMNIIKNVYVVRIRRGVPWDDMDDQDQNLLIDKE